MRTKLCSLLVPTRWRPDMLIACVKSIIATAKDKDCFEILVRIHSDDKETMDAIPRLQTHRQVKVVVGDADKQWPGLSSYHEEMIAVSDGRWCWFLNDDIEFVGKGWDEKLKAIPETGFIVYPQFDKLDNSLYKEVKGGPFPIVPFDSWGKSIKCGFNIDTSLYGWLYEKQGWKCAFIEGLTIHHHRLKGQKYRPKQ